MSVAASPRDDVGVGRAAATRVSGRAWPPARPELFGLLALAAVLNLWNLGENGWANDYYSAAVRSMASSWHAFLSGSFDPAGVMTVDKPPLALWVQALSVRVFGFHSGAILVPQALMGMATAGLAYDLTRRRFGRVAGTAAGLVLVLTPIAVAISRHNNPDAIVALCSVGALWCVVRGLENGRTRWLVWAGVCVGLGFEAKMAAALLVVPGLAAAWLWVAPRGRAAALRALAAGGAALVAVGGAWPLLVALTPASERPWISGTADNSILSLMVGYNGLGRLDGQAGGPGGAGGFGGASSLFGGEAGPLRLLNQALGGQAGWLLGFALVAGVGVLAASRLRREDPRTGWLIAAGGAFLTIAAAFSSAKGIFHPYYVSLLAPFTAVLAGAGVAQLAERGAVATILAPLAIAAGVLAEVKILHDNGALSWLPPLLLGGGMGAAVVLANVTRVRVRLAALAAVLALLLVAPATWAAQTLGHATNGTFPAGGASASSVGGAPFEGADEGVAAAVAYAQTHGGGTVAVASQTGAATPIIASGADVAGIGGFSGRESEITVSWLAAAVEDGRIRWVLTTAQGRSGDGRTGATTAMAAVERSCTPVSAVSGLYDCQGQAGALSATS